MGVLTAGLPCNKPNTQCFVWLQAGIRTCPLAQLSHQGAAPLKVVQEVVLAVTQLAAAQLAHTDSAWPAQQSTTAKAQSCVLSSQRSTSAHYGMHLLKPNLLGPCIAKHGLVQKSVTTAPGRSRGHLTAHCGQLTAQHTGTGSPVTCVRLQRRL